MNEKWAKRDEAGLSNCRERKKEEVEGVMILVSREQILIACGAPWDWNVLKTRKHENKYITRVLQFIHVDDLSCKLSTAIFHLVSSMPLATSKSKATNLARN